MTALLGGDLWILLFDESGKVYLERSETNPKLILGYIFVDEDLATEYATFINSQTSSDRTQRVRKLKDIQYLVDWLKPSLEGLQSEVRLVLVDKLKMVKARKRPVYRDIVTLTQENKN